MYGSEKEMADTVTPEYFGHTDDKFNRTNVPNFSVYLTGLGLNKGNLISTLTFWLQNELYVSYWVYLQQFDIIAWRVG